MSIKPIENVLNEKVSTKEHKIFCDVNGYTKRTQEKEIVINMQKELSK